MIYAHTFLPTDLQNINKNFLVYQTLSFLFIKNNKLKINLYSNQEYFEICKKIGLNYDSYIEIEKNNKHKNYYSASKMEAIKKNADIIIDYDLFLSKDVSSFLSKNDLIYAHKEKIKRYKLYYHNLEFFIKSVPKNVLPEWDYLIDHFYDVNSNVKNKSKYLFAFNCSIIGFKNKKQGKDYAEKSLLLFDYFNKAYPDVSILKNNLHLPTVPEQLFLTFYAKYHKLNTYDLFGENIESMCYAHLGQSKNDLKQDYLGKTLSYLKTKHPEIHENLLKFIV